MSAVLEQLEILRKVMERQKKEAEYDVECFYNTDAYVDYANHALAEIEVTKRLYEEEQSGTHSKRT